MNKKIQHIRTLAATTAAIALLMLAPTACVNNIPGYEDLEANNPEAALDPSTPVTVSAILNAYGTATPTRAITRAEVGAIPAQGEITDLTDLSTSMGATTGNIHLFGAKTGFDFSAHGAVNGFTLRNSKNGSSDIELHISDFNIHPTDDEGNKQAHSRLGMADFKSTSDHLIGFANRAQDADKKIAYKFNMRHTTAKVSVIVMDIFGEPIDMSTALNAEKSIITTYNSEACVFETESGNRSELIPYMNGAGSDGNYPSTTADNAALATTPLAIAKEHKLACPSSNVADNNLINVIVTTNPTATANGNQFPAIAKDDKVMVDAVEVSAIATRLSGADAPADAPAAVLPFDATEGKDNRHRITIALNAYDAGNNTPGIHAINLNDIVLTGLPEGDGRRGNSVDKPSNGHLRYLLPGEHVVVTLKIDRNKLVSATANLAPWIEANANENEGDSGNENGNDSQLANPFADAIFCTELSRMSFNEDGSSGGSLKLTLTTDGNIDMSSKENRELISKIKELDLSGKGIKSLRGIEYFTSLTYLNCYSNSLTELDLSSNTKLVELYCNNNGLTALDLSNNTELTKLYCYFNQITTLDVSHSAKLEELNCYNNQLTALNVSNNTALTKLDCDSNPSTAVLNVSNNTELKTLDCNNNGLTALDVSKNTKLTELNCSSNGLTELDVTLNTELKTLICYSNKLTTLDVTLNTALKTLDCKINQLTALDVTLNKALTTLDCNSNQLNSLVLGDNTNLTALNCRSNLLTELDVTKNINLTMLYCYINNLTALDVSNNTALTTLNCSSNQITALDVSKNTALYILSCHSNRLTALDARKMKLSWQGYVLYCGNQTTDGTIAQELALKLDKIHEADWVNSLVNDDNNINVTPVTYGPEPGTDPVAPAPTAN